MGRLSTVLVLCLCPSASALRLLADSDDASGGGGGVPGLPSMSDAMKDPAMIEQAMKMMQNPLVMQRTHSPSAPPLCRPPHHPTPVRASRIRAQR